MRAAGRCGLSIAIRHERADPAGVPHGFCRAARDHAGPREPFNAPDRLGGAPGACDRAREHARAELPDVLRCGDCADRDLRSGAWHLRPPGGARRSRAPPPRLRGRRVAHLPGRRHRHRPVRGLPLQPYRRLRPPRQSGRSADHRLLDHALGAGCASAHAVRARGDRTRPHGMGNRRGGVDCPPGGGATGRGHARTGDAGGGPSRDRGGRPVALPLAKPVALSRHRSHWRRDGDRGPGTPARHLGRRRRKGDGGARRGRGALALHPSTGALREQRLAQAGRAGRDTDLAARRRRRACCRPSLRYARVHSAAR